MANDIQDFLDLLGYDGIGAKGDAVVKAVKGGAKSVEYTQLVQWICKELKMIYNLEKEVHAITSEEESDKFLIEVSNFLQELGCSHVQLLEGPVTQRLNTEQSKLLLLQFLLSELMAAQIFVYKRAKENENSEIKLVESPIAADLKKILRTFGMYKPMKDVSEAEVFSKIEAGLRESLKTAVPELIGKPLLNGNLTEKQWHTLSEVQKELDDEYYMRREMLLKRLDVTIQSFQLCNKPESSVNQMLATFVAHRSNMRAKPEVDIVDVIAARDDIAILEKASSASVRKNTQTSINKVIIGKVPDRGGRTSEQQAPPPEMPSWQKERASGGGRDFGRGGSGGGGGGGGGGRGSGRVQGNWNRDFRSNYQDNRGHQDSRGGHMDNRGYQESRSGYQDNRGGHMEGRGYQENRGGYRGRHHGGGGRRDGGRRNYY